MPELSRLIEPSRTAVIVVDVQNDFCAPEGAAGKAGRNLDACAAMIAPLQRLLDGARSYGASVVFIQTIHTRWTDSEAWVQRGSGRDRKENCREGTWGAEFFGVAPRADEPVVVKHRYSAFLNTRLDSILRTLRIETLIVTGVATNVCVESTAREGFMRDYHIVFVDDCSAAYKAAAHAATLDNIRDHFGVVATSDEILKAWAAQHSVAPARV